MSLLPGATETLFALGVGDQVVGVTHECDHPAPAARLPRVTRSALDLEGVDGGEIDRRVTAAVTAGAELYRVDGAAVRALAPDLVVAQDVCEVCAVGADQVERELAGVRIVRQHQHSLEDVLVGIEELAGASGVDGSPLVGALRGRIDSVVRAAAARPRVRGVFLEWLDPPYGAGHWTPDLLEAAGIDDPLARPGRPSVPLSWEDVVGARPDLLLLAPCGFGEARARREAARMAAAIDRVGAARVAVFDGSAYFNRPGPRLVDSLEALASVVAEPYARGAGHEPTRPG